MIPIFMLSEYCIFWLFKDRLIEFLCKKRIAKRIIDIILAEDR